MAARAWLHLIALGMLCLSCRGGGGNVAPGAPAPEFSLDQLSSGDPRELQHFRGKFVLLNFWASWCAPCMEEVPALQRLSEELKSDGLWVVSIGIDDVPEELKKVVDRFGITFPVLLDRDGRVKRAYRVTGVPETFLIDSDGRFVMLTDPESGEPTVRMSGPRRWMSPEMLQALRTKMKARK